ncbi:MAG: hypothetical protein JWQ09_4213 [Segetibacter sp.]|nr:hypothetical protein [Segetibacter sp.]
MEESGRSTSSSMFNYDIGGIVVAQDVEEALTELPQNRTLIAARFTTEPPLRPEIIYNIRTFNDLFDSYKPQIKVELSSKGGSLAPNVFSFHRLSDFSHDGLLSQSVFLNHLNQEIQEYNNIIGHFKSNKLLKKAVQSETAKTALYNVLQALLEEIANTINNNSLKDDTEVEQTISHRLDALKDFGGFDLLEKIIDGINNLNIERKARRRIFLSEPEKHSARLLLKLKIELWMEVLKSTDFSELPVNLFEKSEALKKLLSTNLEKVFEVIIDIEITYRAVSLFFENTDGTLKNISFINATIEQLRNLDNTSFIDAVDNELKQCFFKLDLRDNYSILIIPGYLESSEAIEKWAKIAYENKVMLLTDCGNFDSPDEIFDDFDNKKFSSAGIHLSNIAMTCNWLLGREKYYQVEHDEELFLPPSAAFGGKLYTQLMSYVSAGKKHGGLNQVDGVKFDLKKSEIASLEKLGVIPMVNEYGKVIAFSNRTLYNGDNLALQSLSIVRSFDYITKVLVGFLHLRAFENFTSKTEKDFRMNIIRFLDRIVGPNGLIESFKIVRFERDRFRLYLEISLLPYFPAKSFKIKLDFQMSEKGDTVKWVTQYVME